MMNDFNNKAHELLMKRNGGFRAPELEGQQESINMNDDKYDLSASFTDGVLYRMSVWGKNYISFYASIFFDRCVDYPLSRIICQYIENKEIKYHQFIRTTDKELMLCYLDDNDLKEEIKKRGIKL